MQRLKFIDTLGKGLILLTTGLFGGGLSKAFAKAATTINRIRHKRPTLGIQVDKCIGCGSCVRACKEENNVPAEPYYFRTWVERYLIKKDDEIVVQSIEGGGAALSHAAEEQDVLRSFFVPKLCNHCDNPPCAQVCPVGATFQTEEGIVLVDANRCIGCSYCIQACPYGARYMHPVTHTADKCTLCYHRTNQGLLPTCVEVCPTQTRIYGDLESVASPLVRLKRLYSTQVLKPALNTKPKVFYTNLDGVVR